MAEFDWNAFLGPELAKHMQDEVETQINNPHASTYENIIMLAKFVAAHYFGLIGSGVPVPSAIELSKQYQYSVCLKLWGNL